MKKKICELIKFKKKDKTTKENLLILVKYIGRVYKKEVIKQLKNVEDETVKIIWNKIFKIVDVIMEEEN